MLKNKWLYGNKFGHYYTYCSSFEIDSVHQHSEKSYNKALFNSAFPKLYDALFLCNTFKVYSVKYALNSMTYFNRPFLTLAFIPSVK